MLLFLRVFNCFIRLLFSLSNEHFVSVHNDKNLFHLYFFKAMLLFCGVQSFQPELEATFHFLVEDPHALVRRTIACGFHEVNVVKTSCQCRSLLCKD